MEIKFDLSINNILTWFLAILLVLDVNSVFFNLYTVNLHISEITCLLVAIIAIKYFGESSYVYRRTLISVLVYMVLAAVFLAASVGADSYISYGVKFLIFIPIMILLYASNKKIGIDVIKKSSEFICVLAFLSLLMYGLYYFMPSLGTVTIQWGVVAQRSNYIFFFSGQEQEIAGRYVMRNTGIFCEAPMYGFVLIMALATQLFSYGKRNKFKIAVLVITVISTLSVSAAGLAIGLLVTDYFYGYSIRGHVNRTLEMAHGSEQAEELSDSNGDNTKGTLEMPHESEQAEELPNSDVPHRSEQAEELPDSDGDNTKGILEMLHESEQAEELPDSDEGNANRTLEMAHRPEQAEGLPNAGGGNTNRTLKMAPRKYLTYFIIGLFAVIFTAVAIYYLTQFKMSTGMSFIKRVDDYVAGFVTWKTHPLFGAGYNNFEAIKENMLDWRIKYTQVGYSNSWMYILATCGIYGFALYFLSFYGAIKKSVKEKELFIGVQIIILLLQMVTITLAMHLYVLNYVAFGLAYKYRKG